MSTSWLKATGPYVVRERPDGARVRVKAPYNTLREQARRCAQMLRLQVAAALRSPRSGHFDFDLNRFVLDR